MNIEILGVDPRNKGAALMLESIKSQVRIHYPEARFCVELNFNPSERLKYGLWGIIPRNSKFKSLISSIVDIFIPMSITEKFCIVKDKNIDVVLDSSGFAYGDFWGVEKLKARLGRNVVKWKRQNKKVILLPQALGPFTDDEFQDTWKNIVGNVDLLFARDQQSLAHLKSKLGTDLQKKVHLSPDFTSILKPSTYPNLIQYQNAALVIPNEKVISSHGKESKDIYLEFLTSACRCLALKGENVVLLNHEGAKDAHLANQIYNGMGELKDKVEILHLKDPLETKFVISIAKCIVSSRFHGLVSALSSGVPSLAVGWSHKYEELLNDYNSAQFVVDFIDEKDAQLKLENFLVSYLDSSYKDELKNMAGLQREKTNLMWQKIFAIVD